MGRLLVPLFALLLLGALLYMAVCWVGAYLVFSGWFDDPADGFRDATDAELIQVFRDRRTEVDRLRALHLEDRGIGAIGTDKIGRWWRHSDGWLQADQHRQANDRREVLAAVGLRPDRDAEYGRLFAAIGAYRVESRDVGREGYDTEIGLTRRGNVVRSICKSFVFAPGDVPPTPLVPRPGDPDEERFTRLGDGWYLRYLDN